MLESKSGLSTRKTNRPLIAETGARTALGRIGGTLAKKRPASAFELGTHAFGMLILRLTVLLVMLASEVQWNGYGQFP